MLKIDGEPEPTPLGPALPLDPVEAEPDVLALPGPDPVATFGAAD